MKKTTKKGLALTKVLMMTALLVLCTTPLTAEKADTSLLIIEKDGTLTGVTDRTKLTGKLVLPAGIKKIGEGAFYWCTGLTSVDLSTCTSLTEIGRSAFKDCTGLTAVDLSACTSLTEIGRETFGNIASTVQFNIPNESVEKLLNESGLNLKKQ